MSPLDSLGSRVLLGGFWEVLGHPKASVCLVAPNFRHDMHPENHFTISNSRRKKHIIKHTLHWRNNGFCLVYPELSFFAADLPCVLRILASLQKRRLEDTIEEQETTPPNILNLASWKFSGAGRNFMKFLKLWLLFLAPEIHLCRGCSPESWI